MGGDNKERVQMNLFDAVTVARKVLYGGYEVPEKDKLNAYQVIAAWHARIEDFEVQSNKANELIKES